MYFVGRAPLHSLRRRSDDQEIMRVPSDYDLGLPYQSNRMRTRGKGVDRACPKDQWVMVIWQVYYTHRQPVVPCSKFW